MSEVNGPIETAIPSLPTTTQTVEENLPQELQDRANLIDSGWMSSIKEAPLIARIAAFILFPIVMFALAHDYFFPSEPPAKRSITIEQPTLSGSGPSQESKVVEKVKAQILSPQEKKLTQIQQQDKQKVTASILRNIKKIDLKNPRKSITKIREQLKEYEGLSKTSNEKFSPLYTALEQLEEALNRTECEALLENLKEATSIKSLRIKAKNYMKPSQSSPSLTRTSSHSAQPPFNKETFIAQIFNQIKTINLEAPHADRTLVKIQNDLEKNRSKYDSQERKFIDELLNAIKILRDPQSFRPSPEEIKAVKNLGPKIDPRISKKEYDPDMVRNLQKEGKKSFLENLTHCNPKELSTFQKLPALYEKIKAECGLKRLQKHVFIEPDNQLNQRLLNLVLIINHLETLKTRLQTTFQQKWNDEMIANPALHQKLKNLGFLNWVQNFEEHFSTFLNEYMGTVKKSLIASAKDQNTHAMFSLIEVCEKNVKEDDCFNMVHQGHSAKVFAWVKRYEKQIVQTYDQEMDIHRNMGAGTCHQNSIERLKILKENATIPGNAINMGSSSRGRFAERYYTEAYQEGTPRDKRTALIAQSYATQRVDLTFRSAEFMRKELKSYVFNVEQDSNRRETVFLLSGGSSIDKLGHTITVQCDSNRKLYRFMDDNLGVVEFKSKAELCHGLESWFNTAYPSFDLFEIQQFQLI
jgi:hypothetical protein